MARIDRRLVLLLPLLIVVSSCTTTADGPPSSGEGAFYTRSGGSFDKLPFTPADGAGVLEGGRFRTVISDANGVCPAGVRRASTTVLVLDVMQDQPSSGTVVLEKTNDQCATDGTTYRSQSGTVTITSATATVVTGTFDVTLPEGTLAGSFNVPICPGLQLDGAACSPR